MVPGKQPEVEAPARDAGDDRQRVPVEVALQEGGFALGRPRAHPGRAIAQSRPVDEDDDPALFRCAFLRAGQRVCFRHLIAASSRWSARPEGRWQEKLGEMRVRHAWLSPYERVKRRLISSPARGSVHSSVAKPSASGPAVRARINPRRGVAETGRPTPWPAVERFQTAGFELAVPLRHRRARYANTSRDFGRRDSTLE